MKKKIRYLIIFHFILPIIAFRLNAIDFQITGSISELYDDNINNTEQKEWDFITEATIGLGLIHEGKSYNWDLIGRTSFQIYTQIENLNGNSQSVDFNFLKEISANDRLIITDSFGHFPEPQEMELLFGLMPGRSGYYSNTFTASYAKNLLRYIFFSLHYGNTYTNNLNEDYADSISNTGSVNTGHEINTFNIISLFYSYTYNKYLDTGINDNSNSTLQNAGLGYHLFFTRQLSLNSRIGFSYTNYEENDNYTYYLSTVLADQIDEDNNLSISVTKGYAINQLIDEIFDVWNTNINYTRRLSSFLSAQLSGYYQYGTNVSGESEMKARISGLRIGLMYSVTEQFSAGINYNYSYNNTIINEPVYDHMKFNRNQVQIVLTGRF